MMFGRKKKKIVSNLDAFLNQETNSSSGKKTFQDIPLSPSFNAPISSLNNYPKNPATPIIPQTPLASNNRPATAPIKEKEDEVARQIPETPKPMIEKVKIRETLPPYKRQEEQIVRPQGNAKIQNDKIVETPIFKNETFGNPDILDLDLISQESEGKIDARRYGNLIIIALLMSLAVVAQLYFIIGWWQNNSSISEDLTENTIRAQKDIKTFQKSADEALAFSKRADLVSPLLDNHIYWSNFFRYLERNTLSTVTYSDFSGDDTGVYTLEAKSSHFSDINWQVKKFLADDFTVSASVNEGNSGDAKDGKLAKPLTTEEENLLSTEVTRSKSDGPENVYFTIKLKVKPELFLAPKVN